MWNDFIRIFLKKILIIIIIEKYTDSDYAADVTDLLKREQWTDRQRSRLVVEKFLRALFVIILTQQGELLLKLVHLQKQKNRKLYE